MGDKKPAVPALYATLSRGLSLLADHHQLATALRQFDLLTLQQAEHDQHFYQAQWYGALSALEQL